MSLKDKTSSKESLSIEKHANENSVSISFSHMRIPIRPRYL